MAALKKVGRNRSLRLSSGKKVPLRARPEAPAAVYFGVLFRDGATVFMPRRAGVKERDLGELRAHAMSLHEGEIAAVAEACHKCARSIPGCAGCDFGRAAAPKAEESHAESH